MTEADKDFKIAVQGADAVELHVTKEKFGLTVVRAPGQVSELCLLMCCTVPLT